MLQYLGYQDLMLLSQHSPYRRRQIFNLSSLGGHPHNWIGIIKPLLESLETFTAEVSHINSQAWSASSNRQLSGDQTNSGQSGTVFICYVCSILFFKRSMSPLTSHDPNLCQIHRNNLISKSVLVKTLLKIFSILKNIVDPQLTRFFIPCS